MFKLFKELTRPPVSLPSPSDSSPNYTPRGRGQSPGPSRDGLTTGDASRRGSAAEPTAPAKQKNVVETDEQAIKVVGLLHSLKGAEQQGDIMIYVEIFSQFLSLPSRMVTCRAFRRHGGFRVLMATLQHGLTYHATDTKEPEEEFQVKEVQRFEGIRLWFEVLAWAMGDRDGNSYFELHHGYISLLPTLYLLDPATATPIASDDSPGTSSAPAITLLQRPNARILGLLLSHVFSNNYNIITLINSAVPQEDPAKLAEKLGGELVLKWGGALPLIWSYLWSLKEETDASVNGKGKGKASSAEWRLLCSGDLESDESRAKLIETVLRLLLVALQSIPNLFIVRSHLPRLPDFLLTRLYGPERQRKYQVTFPSKDEWSVEEDEVEMEWKAASKALREVYLAALKRVLEAGTTQSITWRLFTLIRIPPVEDNAIHEVGTARNGLASDSSSSEDTSLVNTPTKTTARKRPPPLHLVISPNPSTAQSERLDPEILDLLKLSMKARWPDVFVFKGGRGESAGGLEMRDVGRPWIGAQKGFNFSCWLHISKLNEPLVLFHVSQPGSKYPLFQVRIIESSQIGVLSSVYTPPPPVPLSAATEESPGTAPEPPVFEEVVCHAPDALIPHHQWIHFAIGVRKNKAANSAEIRLFVNGLRVGALRTLYPVPAPVTTAKVQSNSLSDGVRISLGRALQDETSETRKAPNVGREEENEWLLGRSLLLEEAISEDLVRLMHHLGPRYCGNLQEALGKFLTYEGATSINIYLHALAQTAAEKPYPTLTTNSVLVKAIRNGPAVPEETVLTALSAKDAFGDSVINAAVPHPFRARQLSHGTAKMVGHVFPFHSKSLDESVMTVGGGTIILKLIDLAQTSEELLATLVILKDMLKDSWSASEEMERIRGFDLLAAILRPKMAKIMDVSSLKVIMSMLGIHMDRPNVATVYNSAGYRSLGLEFELWSYAPLGVTALYLQHFQYLLVDSKHARYNLLRTFQKSSMVKKLLYALRSNLFDPAVIPVVVDSLRLVLVARWSAEDCIKPVFSYLVSALCQSNVSFSHVATSEIPPSQVPASLIAVMLAELVENHSRLLKLNKILPLHRLLVIFLSSNPAYHVVFPCLKVVEQCVFTPGLESFQRAFEAEGGFALLARTLAPLWRDDIQAIVFRMLLGTEENSTSLVCPAAISCLLAALENLLQAGEEESSRPMQGRTRSGTITSIKSIALSQVNTDFETPASMQTMLEPLLTRMTETYRASAPFRRGLTARRIEIMLPTIADYAAVSASTGSPEIVRPQREAAAQWLSALCEKSKLSGSTINQMKLIQEQLRGSTASPKVSAAVMALSPASPARPSSSYFGGSFSSRFGTSPSSFGPGSPGRRRPTTDMTPIRSKSIVEKRVPLKRVLTGESILQEGKDKNAAWKMIILSVDATKHGKMTLERKEHWRRLSLQDWPSRAAILRTENGVWQDEDMSALWRLDGSEGPLRMRQKLRDAIPSIDELSSAVSRVNMAPWEDPFNLALGQATPIEEEPAPSHLAPPAPSPDEDALDTESFVENEEENASDKLRRIAKTLQAGDVVEEAHVSGIWFAELGVAYIMQNIVRIVGVDACPGLLILGKKNLYLIDGLVQTADGEVIDAKDAPKDVLSIPSGTLVELEAADLQSHRWSYNEVIESNKRAFLFRDVALELYFSDKLNFLIVFKDKKERQGVVSKMSAKKDNKDTISRSVIGNFVLDTVAKAMDNPEQQLESMTRRWQAREISNFAYLALLNQHANRTPNDVTQYPVFPWVLTDYVSQTLDLEKETSFRNLSLPMGALTPARREAAIERYSATEGVGEKPFHYGTHYSSSMIVCGFMIRVSPFTEIFLALQGGTFDLADRLFSSVPRAWESASADNRGDVRELIPEFYYSAAFLLNLNHLDLGKKQVSGETVDNVGLPPWALGDPGLFVHLHREALESDYVSKHLPAWIDLTFGCKQRDPASYTCFHPLSYRGGVGQFLHSNQPDIRPDLGADLENIEDDSEKAASTAIIHNCLPVFFPSDISADVVHHSWPNPAADLQNPPSPPVPQRKDHFTCWAEIRCGGALASVTEKHLADYRLSETTTPINDVVDPTTAEAKPTPHQKYRLVVPGNTHLSLQYGFSDGSLRIYYHDSAPRLVFLVEGISATEAIFASPTLLVTACSLGVLTAWRMAVKGQGQRKGDVSLTREATLCGHSKRITCLAASTSWNFLVSGSEDGTAMVWDMNRIRYTRSLQLGRSDSIQFCAVNEADGQIALATQRHVHLFSLNGHPIASASVEDERVPGFSFGFDLDPRKSAHQKQFTGGIAFLKREFIKDGVVFVVGIDSEVALFRCMPGRRQYEDQDVKPWRLVEQGRLHRSDDHEGGHCTMVRFIGETLYAAFKPALGSNKYSLYQWSLPESNARHVPEVELSQASAQGVLTSRSRRGSFVVAGNGSRRPSLVGGANGNASRRGSLAGDSGIVDRSK
ncbi:hypothetical protein P7C73_g1097, partial [Tremellales sp. Uapishka_1]